MTRIVSLLLWLLLWSSAASSQQQSRTLMWDNMVHNFHARWEGRTCWFDGNNADKPPLASVYQLEFPQDGKLGTGIWRGWNIFKEGDTRVVPLSRETVIDRTPGTSTFQFRAEGTGGGVGGRCPLYVNQQGSGEMGDWGFEVNFFHNNRRRGLVLLYKKQDDGMFHLEKRALVMDFCRAPGGFRDDGRIDMDACTVFDSEMAEATDDEHFSLPQNARSFVMSSDSYVEREVDYDKSKDVRDKDKNMVSIFYPQGLFICVPLTVSSTAGPVTFQIGCDYRVDGGSVKRLTVEYDESKRLMGWTLDDFS